MHPRHDTPLLKPGIVITASPFEPHGYAELEEKWHFPWIIGPLPLILVTKSVLSNTLDS